MRALLAEQFKLKLHTESRELDAYALVMLKPGVPGLALKPSPTDCKALMEQARQGTLPPTPPPPVNGIVPCSVLARIGQMSFDGFPMSQAAGIMVGQAGRPVVDRTGLTELAIPHHVRSGASHGPANTQRRAAADHPTDD